MSLGMLGKFLLKRCNIAKYLILAGVHNAPFGTPQACRLMEVLPEPEGIRSEVDPIKYDNDRAMYLSRIRAIQNQNRNCK